MSAEHEHVWDGKTTDDLEMYDGYVTVVVRCQECGRTGKYDDHIANVVDDEQIDWGDEG